MAIEKREKREGSEKKKRRKREKERARSNTLLFVLIGVGAVLSLIVVGVGAYFAVQMVGKDKLTAPESFAAYESPEAVFRVEYPTGWKVSPSGIKGRLAVEVKKSTASISVNESLR